MAVMPARKLCSEAMHPEKGPDPRKNSMRRVSRGQTKAAPQGVIHHE